MHSSGNADCRLSRQPWTRRRLLQAGGLGMLGLSLPEYLSARTSSNGSRGAEKSCIFIVQYGGASHIDTLDPKPDAPENIRGPYRPIRTPVPGFHVGDMLPRLASLANHYCVVRSMSHGQGDHDGGMHVCLTGKSRPQERTPCFGSVTARLRPSGGNLPSYVWLQNLDGDVRLWYLTSGFLPAIYSPMMVGRGADNPSAASFRVTAFDPPAGVSTARLRDRERLLTTLGTASGAGGAMRQFQERAVDLVTGPDARRAFNLEQEPAALRDRFGRGPLGQNLLLARRLIEAGVRLVSVNAWCGVPRDGGFVYSPNFTQGWDHHGAAVQQCGIFSNGQFGLGFALPRFDQAVSALLVDLSERGLLEETLVVVVGEFGRTPEITNQPHPGRDHWPQCYSAILAGAGIGGGMVYGASDRHGRYVKDKPVSPENFGATLFHALGIPPETRLSPDGFTEPASTGQPVLELFV